MKIIYAPLILPLLLFFFCTDEYSVEIRDAMIDTVSGNQNVVIINYYYDVEDWKNVMDFDITLKNDVRMYIAGCKRNKNGEFIYRYVSNINNWSLYEIIHYEDSDKYESKFPKDTAKDFLGNNSLEYLLENYQKLYDFYMSVPEFSATSYNKDKETFDNIPDEFVFDVYDEESCKVIGVGKLYRVKKDIMQVNNGVKGTDGKTDWIEAKCKLNLKKGVLPTPFESLKAGVYWLAFKNSKCIEKGIKGLSYTDNHWDYTNNIKFENIVDKIEKNVAAFYYYTWDKTWDRGIKNYNGGGVKNYYNLIMKIYESARMPKISDYYCDDKDGNFIKP